MFVFEKCSYEELQIIRERERLLLSGWTLIEKEYIDETKKIFDKAGNMIALINFYFHDEKKEKMCIVLFEVFPRYRNRGLGKRIIDQFLKRYHGEVELLPSSKASEFFWEKCGFVEGCYLDLR